MELPFLKNKSKNQGGGGPVSTVHASTRPDKGTMDDSLIDHVADEFFQAIEKKDRALLKEALTALVLHITDQDGAEQEESDE